MFSSSSIAVVASYLRPAALLTLLALGACNDDDDAGRPTTTYGPSVAIGSGSARSYLTADASGNPSEIGIRVSETAIATLPATPATGIMYDLALPTNDGKTPFDHVSFDWNPNGHEPLSTYGDPHFDAHFYMQPMAEQHAITLDDPKGDIFPASALLPAGYITPPNVAPGRTVPMMGRHWVDPTSPEYQPNGKFTSTFIYGTYNGKVTFIEPMFTKAQLTGGQDFHADIKQPQTYDMSGKYFPTRYHITHDAAAREYVISLSDMVKR